MTSAGMVLQSLFAGPSPGIVGAVLVVGVITVGAVLWMIRGLLVDPRADGTPSEFAGAPHDFAGPATTGALVADAVDAAPLEL
jgi:hypothetical protein